MLVLPTVAWANSLNADRTQPSVQVLSYSLGDQARTLGIESELGAIDPGAFRRRLKTTETAFMIGSGIKWGRCSLGADRSTLGLIA
jgi:hypothetical protein